MEISPQQHVATNIGKATVAEKLNFTCYVGLTSQPSACFHSVGAVFAIILNLFILSPNFYPVLNHKVSMACLAMKLPG